MEHLRIDRVLGFEHGMPPEFGVIIAVLGVLFLLLGWRLHQYSIVIVGFLVGAFIGQLITRWLRVDPAWGLVIGGGSTSLLAQPLHRVLIFLLAGLALGMMTGEGIRVMAPAGYLWGFFPGFVAGGILSLYHMRTLMIFSTAFMGAVFFLWGLMVFVGAWIYQPAGTFYVRHPIGSLLILLVTILAGCVAQVSLFPQQRPLEED